MKKYILPRALIGFMTGVLIEIIIIITVSLANGELILFTPDFLQRCKGNMVLAYVLQHLLVGLIGLTFAEASISFQVETWSFGKQYLVFCITSTAVWVPVSLFCWFPQNIWGVVSLVTSFSITYLINYLVQLTVSRKNVRLLNEKLREKTAGREEI